VSLSKSTRTAARDCDVAMRELVDALNKLEDREEHAFIVDHIRRVLGHLVEGDTQAVKRLNREFDQVTIWVP